jgi:hypothetical protein
MPVQGVAAALAMVLLHRADGGEVIVAVPQITSLHSAAMSGPKVMHQTAGCVVWLADGRMLTVMEPCETVRKLLEQAR